MAPAQMLFLDLTLSEPISGSLRELSSVTIRGKRGRTAEMGVGVWLNDGFKAGTVSVGHMETQRPPR